MIAYDDGLQVLFKNSHNDIKICVVITPATLLNHVNSSIRPK